MFCLELDKQKQWLLDLSVLTCVENAWIAALMDYGPQKHTQILYKEVRILLTQWELN